MSCEKQCPFDAVLDAAEEITTIGDHTDLATTKGGIALTRTALRILRKNINCEGATANQNGQIVCPLQERTLETRSIATSQWLQSQFLVDLKNFGSGEQGHETPQTGQYL